MKTSTSPVPSSMKKLTCVASLALCFVFGCDPQATEAYRGDAMMTVRIQAPTDGVALPWVPVSMFRAVGKEQQALSEGSPNNPPLLGWVLRDEGATGELPANVRIDLVEPPAADALFTLELPGRRVRFATGQLGIAAADHQRVVQPRANVISHKTHDCADGRCLVDWERGRLDGGPTYTEYLDCVDPRAMPPVSPAAIPGCISVGVVGDPTLRVPYPQHPWLEFDCTRDPCFVREVHYCAASAGVCFEQTFECPAFTSEQRYRLVPSTTDPAYLENQCEVLRVEGDPSILAPGLEDIVGALSLEHQILYISEPVPSSALEGVVLNLVRDLAVLNLVSDFYTPLDTAPVTLDAGYHLIRFEPPADEDVQAHRECARELHLAAYDEYLAEAAVYPELPPFGGWHPDDWFLRLAEACPVRAGTHVWVTDPKSEIIPLTSGYPTPWISHQF